MDRRTALKNLTLSIGYAVATPTIMSVLSSCSDASETWTPQFFSEVQKHMVTHIVDIILPTDDLPGALDVNIPQFIDKMYHDIEVDSKKELFTSGSNYFADSFKKTFQKDILKGTKEDFEVLVSNYFDISDDVSKHIMKDQNIKNVAKKDIESYSIYKFLLSVRYYIIFGYCTSEKVGENILAYDPVPGVYNGCISVETATNGRAWSL